MRLYARLAGLMDEVCVHLFHSSPRPSPRRKAGHVSRPLPPPSVPVISMGSRKSVDNGSYGEVALAAQAGLWFDDGARWSRARTPYLIPNFWTATAIMAGVVAIELAIIAGIRNRYMDTPLLSAAFQVVVGGLLVFGTGILIGSS